MAVRESVVRVLVDTDASGAGGKLAVFGRTAARAAIGVLAVGAGAVYGANKLAELGNRVDDSNARIENITRQMRLFGKEAGTVSDRLIELAEKTALQTGVDQNAIKATQAKLLTFRALAKTADTVGGAFDRATLAAVDMAAAGFGTAETNAVQLGKALQDPANKLTALSRIGALTEAQIKKIGDEFKRTGDISAAQAQILAAVETQVGGTAEAMSGGFDRMKVAASQFGEKLAEKALPALDKFGDFMVDKALPAGARFATVLQEKLGPALTRVGEFIVEKVVPAAKRFNEWFVDKIVPGLQSYVTPAIEGLRKGFAQVQKAVQDNEPALRDIGTALKKVAEFIAEKVAPVVGKMLGIAFVNMGIAIRVAIVIVSALMIQFNALKAAIDAVVSAVGRVKDALSNLPSLPDIPGIGGGARIGAGGVAGAVALPGVAGAGFGGGAVVVNVNGFVGDEVKLAGEIRRVLRDDLLRFGGQTP